jgi:hypothetical protein
MRASAKSVARVLGGLRRSVHRCALADGLVVALTLMVEPPPAVAGLAAPAVVPTSGAMVVSSRPAAVDGEAAARVVAKRCRGRVEIAALRSERVRMLSNADGATVRQARQSQLVRRFILHIGGRPSGWHGDERCLTRTGRCSA